MITQGAWLPVLAFVVPIAGIVAAIIALAVVALIGGVFLLRSGKGGPKKGATAQTGDWQRQAAQSGAAPAAWNQQSSDGAWAQQAQQGQQAAGWNAPNPAAQQQPNNPWGPNAAQQQPNNPWGAANTAGQQQPNNQWGAPNAAAAQQPANQWGSTTPAPGQLQPQNNQWGAPNAAAAQQPANQWSATTPAQQPANQWGAPAAQSPWEQPAAPAAQDPWAAQQQAAQGQPWSAQAAPVQQTPGGFGASNPSNPAWGQQPTADPWQQQQPQAGTPSSPFQAPAANNTPAWQQQQQPGGFSQGPASMFGNNDGDKTILRTTGPQAGPQPGASGIGMVRVEEGKEPGRIYEVRKESLSIGRSRESDIFLEDLAVSRLHASVVNMGNGNYVLKDEGSANGTKVNGQLVNKFQTYPLQEGDRIQLGQTVLVFSRR